MSARPCVQLFLAHAVASRTKGAPIPECLDADDRAHLARFRFERDRALATDSRVLQRWALVAAAGLPRDAAAQLRFERDANGRPQVTAPASLRHWRFSAANTAGLVGCAVSDQVVPGLDLEPVARTLAPELVAHCCRDDERIALDALPAAARPAAFHALWTRKEAYLKACGLGLSLAPRRVGFVPAADGRWQVRLDGDRRAAGDREVFDVPAGEAHVAALCLPAGLAPPPPRWVRLADADTGTGTD